MGRDRALLQPQWRYIHNTYSMIERRLCVCVCVCVGAGETVRGIELYIRSETEGDSGSVGVYEWSNGHSIKQTISGI